MKSNKTLTQSQIEHTTICKQYNKKIIQTIPIYMLLHVRVVLVCGHVWSCCLRAPHVLFPSPALGIQCNFEMTRFPTLFKPIVLSYIDQREGVFVFL